METWSHYTCVSLSMFFVTQFSVTYVSRIYISSSSRSRMYIFYISYISWYYTVKIFLLYIRIRCNYAERRKLMVIYSIAYLSYCVSCIEISLSYVHSFSYVISLISYISYTSSLMDPPLLHLLFCPSYILVPILYILLYAYLLYISPIL